MRKWISLTLLLAVIAAVPSLATAQATLGPAVAFHDDFDLGVGAALNMPMQEFGGGVGIMADFYYFFPEGDLDYLEINANLVYGFALETTAVTPYILGGLNVANLSLDIPAESQTEVGLNLGGGVDFDMGRFRPNIGVKIEVNGGEGLVVFAHLPFVIGN